MDEKGPKVLSYIHEGNTQRTENESPEGQVTQGPFLYTIL
jgi:hypothetical protein